MDKPYFVSAATIKAAFGLKPVNSVALDIIEVTSFVPKTIEEIFNEVRRQPGSRKIKNLAQMIPKLLAGLYLPSGQRVFDCLQEKWFTRFTFADSSLHHRLNSGYFINAVANHPMYGSLALREILYVMLRREQMTMKKIVEKIIATKRFSTDDKVDVERYIRRVFQANRDIFTTSSQGFGKDHQIFWKAVDAKRIPSIYESCANGVVAKDRRDALCVLMSRHFQVSGWNLCQLYQVTTRLPYGFLLVAPKTFHDVGMSFRGLLDNKSETRFERILSSRKLTKGNPVRWRVKPVDKFKAIITPEDASLVLQLALAEVDRPLSYHELRPLMQEYARFFGYDAIGLTENLVNKAMEQVVVSALSLKSKEPKYVLKLPAS